MTALSTRSLLGALGFAAAMLHGCAGGGGMERDASAARDGSIEGSDAAIDGTDGGVPDDGAIVRDDAGGSCTDVCAVGAERCAGTDIQRCVIDPASRCTVWGAAEACPGALFCSGDVCTATCSDACTDGARRCGSGDGFQVCALQSSGCTEWGAEEACGPDQTCSGAGVCMACTEGAERCAPDGNVQTCSGGRWALSATCPFGCDSAACRSSVTCTPAAYRCSGVNVETCNATGTAWLHVSTCAVGCSSGLCTGACTPGATRCNAGGVETCNATGTAWDAGAACTTFCDAGVCALDGLEIAANTTMEGDVLVDGAVVVRSGATLTSATGSLTIRATSITIENGASISVAATGDSPDGRGGNGVYTGSTYTGGGGGAYGVAGGGYTSSIRGRVWGSSVDSDVGPGSRGGSGYSTSGGAGGAGGGVLRLIADTITIAGQVTANGQPGTTATYAGGGGSGGGVLIAADDVVITGAISAVGGAGGTASSSARNGGAGGNGRVKILSGASRDTTGAVISGVLTQGLLPPLVLSSSTHPDPSLVYNDGFEVVSMSWVRPFAPITGYYWRVAPTIAVPTPATGTFAATEVVAFPRSALVAGDNLFQIASVDPMITVGTVESSFRVRFNTAPPPLISTSHASSTTWSPNRDVFMRWTMAHGDEHYRGVYYVMDHFGDTVPDATANFVPIMQKQVLLSGTADGIWAFHIVSVDTQGYLTRAAAHYQVRIGPDPGNGTVFGQIVDSATSMPISGVRVTLNRDLFAPQTTNATGNFNFMTIPAGSYEVRISAPGYRTEVRTVAVTAGTMTAANASLVAE
jgi:hypothetical protein